MSELEFRVDATRTQLHEHFFNVFAFDSRDELFAAFGDIEVGLDSLARSHDSRESVYSGWVYWFLFLKGYLRYAETGEVEDDNIYLDYLVHYYGPRNHDPGIAFELCQPDLAAACRLAFRGHARRGQGCGGLTDVDDRGRSRARHQPLADVPALRVPRGLGVAPDCLARGRLAPPVRSAALGHPLPAGAARRRGRIRVGSGTHSGWIG